MPFRFNLAVALAVLATMPCFSVSAQPASFRFELLPSPDIDVYYKRPTGPLFHPTLAKAYVSDQFAGRTTVYDTATWDPVVLLEHAYASHSELTPVTEREAFRGYPNAAAFSHGGEVSLDHLLPLERQLSRDSGDRPWCDRRSRRQAIEGLRHRQLAP